MDALFLGLLISAVIIGCEHLPLHALPYLVILGKKSTAASGTSNYQGKNCMKFQSDSVAI